MRRVAVLAAISLAVPITACTIDRAVSSGWTVSPNLNQDCRDQCAKLEMRVSAVVLSGNSAACVCEPESTSLPAGPPRAALGGAGALLISESEARVARQQRMNQPPPAASR